MIPAPPYMDVISPARRWRARLSVLCSLVLLQSFTPLPVSAQIALEPAADLSREKAGGDVECKLARMRRMTRLGQI